MTESAQATIVSAVTIFSSAASETASQLATCRQLSMFRLSSGIRRSLRVVRMDWKWSSSLFLSAHQSKKADMKESSLPMNKIRLSNVPYGAKFLYLYELGTGTSGVAKGCQRHPFWCRLHASATIEGPGHRCSVDCCRRPNVQHLAPKCSGSDSRARWPGRDHCRRPRHGFRAT